MVKCLIRIRTKVNVHLRMINHCYRDVKVRVLNLGPRLLGRALGALPLFPALTGGVPGVVTGINRDTGISSECQSLQPEPVQYLKGLEALRDSAHSTPVRSSENINALTPHPSQETVISEEAYTPSCSILPTPETESNLELPAGQQGNGTSCSTQNEEGHLASTPVPETEIPPPALPGLEGSRPTESEPEQVNKFLQSVFRLLAVTFFLLLALLMLLVILAESELELAFLRDIRLTPEFQQFHYQYFCPLRRWLSCKLHPLLRLIDS